MKLKLAVLGLFVLFSGVANASPWTGEKADGMYSDMTITNIHTGVVDFRPYFCIEAVRSVNNTDIKACAVRGYSNWAAGFDEFYNQAMYYYATGQLVRIYYQPNVWTHEGLRELTRNAIVGFSTCSSIDHCLDLIVRIHHDFKG